MPPGSRAEGSYRLPERSPPDYCKPWGSVLATYHGVSNPYGSSPCLAWFSVSDLLHFAGGVFWVNSERIPTSGDSRGLPPGGLGEVGDAPVNPFYATPLRYAGLPWEGGDVPEESEGSSPYELEDPSSPSTSAGSREPPAVEEGTRRTASEAEGHATMNRAVAERRL